MHATSLNAALRPALHALLTWSSRAAGAVPSMTCLLHLARASVTGPTQALLPTSPSCVMQAAAMGTVCCASTRKARRSGRPPLLLLLLLMWSSLQQASNL
jgi:hypothetical protein